MDIFRQHQTRRICHCDIDNPFRRQKLHKQENSGVLLDWSRIMNGQLVIDLANLEQIEVGFNLPSDISLIVQSFAIFMCSLYNFLVLKRRPCSNSSVEIILSRIFISAMIVIFSHSLHKSFEKKTPQVFELTCCMVSYRIYPIPS